MNRPRKVLSIITPCYNERDNLDDCYQAVKGVFDRSLPQYDYEHIFCDNASTDDTPSILQKLAQQDHRVKVIFNARNFGPFCSTFNGLMSSEGDAVVVLLAADLQDPPDLIPHFVKRWEEGNQVVYGIRKNREETLLMRSVRKCYYRLVSKFANIHIPLDVGEFQLIDRVVVQALREFDDYYPYIRGMIASCGFCATGVEYVWKARQKGFSKNKLYHLIDQGLNGFVSFTKVPLRLCLLMGILLSSMSLVFSLFSLMFSLLAKGQIAAPGIPTLIVAIFFFSGIQLFFFGILGEYISAVHFQVRKRPLVIEKGRLNFSKPSSGSNRTTTAETDELAA